jgi:hypothetical protein
LIERGESNPTWGTVRGIAKALEMSVAELARRAGRLDGEVDSKAHPAARHRGIGFRIGDAFSADDPIARWATVLSIAANDTIYLNIRLIEGDLAEEQSIYYFRLVAAHFFEAAIWLKSTRKILPEVDELITSLDDAATERYERIVSFASQRHRFFNNLKRSRSTLFHYPVIHPGREQAGEEELANAMGAAAKLPGWIEAGDDYATFRAGFADQIAVQFLSEDDQETKELMMELRGPVFDLVLFSEAVLLKYLTSLPSEVTTIWEPGQKRPEVPESEPGISPTPP